MEILETIALANLDLPRPRRIDPSVLSDIIAIRRLVDEASAMTVRATSGVVSTALLNARGGNGPMLSPERRHRLRVEAVSKLSQAYHIDEIACAVAVMAGASSLGDVADLVLTRDPGNLGARYVHFFHEKIPSRQFDEYTTLGVLDELIAQGSATEVIRTRATAKMLKEKFPSAADDLTEALARVRAKASFHFDRDGSAHSRQAVGLPSVAELDISSQPPSLERQILFSRATAYTHIACRNVHVALSQMQILAHAMPSKAAGTADGDGTSKNGTTEDSQLAKVLAKSFRSVRDVAKRALRDYMQFLAHFDYSPDYPDSVLEDFTGKLDRKITHARAPRKASPFSAESAPHTVHTIDKMFAAAPPADLPPYPPSEIATLSSSAESQATVSGECITNHPLLMDALHGLLLVHALLQTSPKEMTRHAYNVARLARLESGYYAFQPSRSPHRADWIEVLKRCGGKDWIELAGPWDILCRSPDQRDLVPTSTSRPAATPADAPAGQLKALESTHQEDGDLSNDVKALALDESEATEATPGDSAIKNGASLNGFSGGIVHRTASEPHDGAIFPTGSASTAIVRRHPSDDAREYPIVTERAAAVARWIKEAPPLASVPGAGGRKKKKPARSQPALTSQPTETTEMEAGDSGPEDGLAA
jgi:hypothetical protein